MAGVAPGLRRRAAGQASRGRSGALVSRRESRLLALRERLVAGYHFGPYRTFTVRDPKRRLVAAAPFEDRVVHHAMVSLLGPRLERRMIPTSFACRTGLGGSAARRELLRQCRSGRAVYFAKCDVRRYFPSVRHDVLGAQLARGCGDAWAMSRVTALLDSWHTEGAAGTGLPIGCPRGSARWGSRFTRARRAWAAWPTGWTSRARSPPRAPYGSAGRRTGARCATSARCGDAGARRGRPRTRGAT